MAMIRHRNLSTHTDDEATINEIVVAVTDSYQLAFQQLQSALAQRQQERL
jgi:hypothetical protein